MKRPIPSDLDHCEKCGKVIGTPDTRGWCGAECQCDQPKGDALRGAHSISAGTVVEHKQGPPEECSCPERAADLCNYGIHICIDGKRVAPEDFYQQPPPEQDDD